MAKGINKWTGVGFLGKDPETKTTDSGLVISKVSLGCPGNAKVNGEWTEETEWVPVTFFGKPAELIGEYTHKGDKLFVEGRMKTNSWEKDGVKKYHTGIIANEFVFMAKPKAQQQNTPPAVDSGFGDDDIPF